MLYGDANVNKINKKDYVEFLKAATTCMLELYQIQNNGYLESQTLML